MALETTLKSLFWPFVEAISAVLTGAVGVLVIARIIGAEAFGLGSIALGIVLIAQVGVNSLVHDALVRSERVSSEDIDVAFTASVAGALVVGSLAIVAAPLIALLSKQKDLTGVIWAFVPMLVLSALSITMIAERRRALDFNTVAFHQIGGRVLGTILGITAAMSGFGVWSLVIQYTCASAYTSTAMFVLASRWPRVRFSWLRLAPMLHFCSPIIASQLIIYATNWFFLFTMGRWYGLGAAGHWSVATRIAESLFGSVLQAVYHVALARLALHQSVLGRLRESLLKGDALSGLATIPLLVAVAATAEPLLGLSLGPSWVPAGQLALGPLVGSFLLVRQILPSTALRVIGISAYGLMATLANTLVAVGGVLLFGRHSPLAVSAIYALSMLPGYLLIQFVAARKFHLSLERDLYALCRDLALAAVAFGLGQGVSGQLQDQALLVKVAAAGSTAFLVAAFLMAITRLKTFRTILKFEVSGLRSPIKGAGIIE
jgi:O-antigen/teichoic acid export membrane protein